MDDTEKISYMFAEIRLRGRAIQACKFARAAIRTIGLLCDTPLLSSL